MRPGIHDRRGVVFAVGRRPVSVGHLAATLTRLWTNAPGLASEPGA